MTTAPLSNPTTETVAEPQLAALLSAAAVAPLATGWLRITGSDRVRWLNGMATNSVQQLAPDQGAYNFFLNAQGRIHGDGYIFATPDALLLETAQAEALVPYLDHYIIMDDVELADLSASRHGLALIGPKAPALLETLGLAVPAELTLAEQTFNGSTILVLHAYSPLVPRLELWADTAEAADALRSALEQQGALPAEADALHALRVLEGTPLYGTDIRNTETARELPQETNQARALHFNKGCYLGQEIVERIRSRGNVHRTFGLFRLNGDLPAPGTALTAADKAVGELTSLAAIPLASGSSLHLALGYLRLEALERQAQLTYSGGTAQPLASFAETGIKLPR